MKTFPTVESTHQKDELLMIIHPSIHPALGRYPAFILGSAMQPTLVVNPKLREAPGGCTGDPWPQAACPMTSI